LLRHRNCPAVGQTWRPPVDQKYLEKGDSPLWYVRSSEGLTFGIKPASTTDLYHSEAFRASKIMNYLG